MTSRPASSPWPRRVAFAFSIAGIAACAHTPPTPVVAPPTEARSTSTCHWTAFSKAPTAQELERAISQLSDVEAAVKQTFDEDAKRPLIVGPSDDVLGTTDPMTGAVRVPGAWRALVDEATRRDRELRAIRPTALVSARALFDVGAMYEALAAALAAWAPGDGILTPEQRAKLSELSKQSPTVPIEAAVLEGFTKLAARRQREERVVLQSNAYVAYLGVLHLVSMATPNAESVSYRQRAGDRVRALGKVADVAKATTSLEDPTSSGSECPLLLGPPEDYCGVQPVPRGVTCSTQ